MKMLSVIIPSRNELFLQNTILDILKNAVGDIEVIPVLDGYEPPKNEIVNDSRVNYLRMPNTSYMKKRHCINTAVKMAQGEYIMALDAHCLVSHGFDKVLVEGHESGCVQVLRRHRLDAKKWCLQTQVDNRPPIDYEYLMFPLKFDYPAFHGFKWDRKTLAKWDIEKDDIITAQGSMWFMEKDFFKDMGFMQVDGYTGWGQEAEEIIFSTYRAGGRAFVNKKAYYAHLHKGREYGRMYFMSKRETTASYKYSFNYWAMENKKFFVDYINKFMPLPGWPRGWEKEIYG